MLKEADKHLTHKPNPFTAILGSAIALFGLSYLDKFFDSEDVFYE